MAKSLKAELNEKRLNQWLKKTTQGLSFDQMVSHMDQTFSVIWAESNKTLSDVTLEAIFDRVIHSSSEEYPWIQRIVVTSTGLNFSNVVDDSSLTLRTFQNSFQLLMINYISILERLGGRVLTSSIYAAIEKTTPPSTHKQTKSKK